MSFTVGRGEILGVGGPNGAGKTTLFDVISGLTRASGGTITFDGQDITGKSADRVCHAGISRTFQLNAAYDTLTVEENVLVRVLLRLSERQYFRNSGSTAPPVRVPKRPSPLLDWTTTQRP